MLLKITLLRSHFKFKFKSHNLWKTDLLSIDKFYFYIKKISIHMELFGQHQV